MTRVQIVAHRGASADAPENTLAAFQEARRQGARMIELDVQLCASGEVVVFHDDSLERCTNVADLEPAWSASGVHERTWAELSRLDASASLKGYSAGSATGIPSLSQTLDWLEACPEMSLNIELKTLPRLPRALTSAVVRAILDRKLQDRILISSFDHPALREVKALTNQIRTGVLLAERLVDCARYARDYVKADAINPGFYLLGALSEEGLSGRLCEEARALGLEVNVWTVNEMALVPALAAAGVSSIITDHPGRALAALSSPAGS